MKNLSERAITDRKMAVEDRKVQGGPGWEDAISGLVPDPVGFSVFGREGDDAEKTRRAPAEENLAMCVS